MDIDIKNQLVSKTARVINFIGEHPNSNIKEISKALEIDYNFVSKIVQRCEEQGLMTTQMVTREKRVKLVEKGEKVSTFIAHIEALMN